MLRASLPVACFGDLLDVPCLGIPLSNRDAAGHAANEHLDVARYLDGIVISGVLLSQLADGLDPG